MHTIKENSLREELKQLFSFGSMSWRIGVFQHSRGGTAPVQDWKVLSQSQNLSNWPSISKLFTHQKPNQALIRCLMFKRDSTFFSPNNIKHISLSQLQTVKGISKSEMSCLKGSTVNACRIFFSLLSVLTSETALCFRALRHAGCTSLQSAESADCGSPECHIPYVIQNQYLTNYCPYTQWPLEIFFPFSGVTKKRKAVPTPAHHYIHFSSFTFLLDFCIWICLD